VTLPENVSPSGPTETPPEVPAAEPVVEVAPVVEEETPEEVASDSALRAWAKDNGIEDVPSSGRLSATWRDQITAAMTDALTSDPKEEASAEPTSTESSTSVKTTTEPPVPVRPEFDNPYNEYRSVFKAPDTFVTGQAFTA
jgi:hypothetical protein